VELWPSSKLQGVITQLLRVYCVIQIHLQVRAQVLDSVLTKIQETATMYINNHPIKVDIDLLISGKGLEGGMRN
jgi:hypothetical protein